MGNCVMKNSISPVSYTLEYKDIVNLADEYFTSYEDLVIRLEELIRNDKIHLVKHVDTFGHGFEHIINRIKFDDNTM